MLRRPRLRRGKPSLYTSFLQLEKPLKRCFP